jgi:hypothetical protein
MIKKKLQPGGKVIKGRPMGGAIGAYSAMEKKAKAGDAQAQADLKLEKSNYKKFGDGPGSGPSGAMPTPKKKMGGAVKKAQSGGKFPDLSKDGKITKKDILIGKGVLPKKAQMGATMTAAPIMKKGGSMKKCKYGCK